MVQIPKLRLVGMRLNNQWTPSLTMTDVFCERHDAKGYHFFAKGANGISQGVYNQKL